MLTQYDIDMMAGDVRDIINMWNTKLVILKPLSKDKQTNWNSIMHEYSGPIMYTKYTNVVAERKDQQNMIAYDMNISSRAGDSADGQLVFTVPDTYTFIDDTCRVIYKDVQWHIVHIKERIGEVLLICEKLTTGTEIWPDPPFETKDVGDYHA